MGLEPFCFFNPCYDNMRTIKIEDLPKLPSQRDVDNLKSQYNQLLERIDLLEKTVLPVMSASTPNQISGVSKPNIGT